MANPSMAFERCWKTPGLDFGWHLSHRLYKTRRASMDDLEGHLDEEEKREMAKTFDRLPVYVYCQSPTSCQSQKVWRYMTFGMASCQTRIAVFHFDTADLKEIASRQWPSELRFGDVQSSILEKCSLFEFARYEIQKGMLTFYLYAVRRIGTTFQAVNEFKKLKSLIRSFQEVNDPSFLSSENLWQILLPLFRELLLGVLFALSV